MPTTFERERQLQDEIAPRVERDLPGVDVLAVELLSPDRFCVYVDHPDGVDHALCERVTEVLRDFNREYGVDVSSPGLERPLRRREHFASALGRRIRLRTTSRKLNGTVASADADFLVLEAEDGERREIPYSEIVRANLVPISDQKGSVT
jgi:ribosome maturation factor RimP